MKIAHFYSGLNLSQTFIINTPRHKTTATIPKAKIVDLIKIRLKFI